MNPSHRHTTSALTRRAFIRRGGAVGATTFVALNSWGPARAQASTVSADGLQHLRRSSYTALKSPDFTVAGSGDATVVRLENVSDLAGGGAQPKLAGSDDAFALAFAGPLGAALPQGTHTFSHPELGKFELFIAPVDEPGADQSYEVVVNRSVGADHPTKTTPKAPPATPAKPPQAATHPKPHANRPPRIIGHTKLRRSRHGVVATIALSAERPVKHIHAWIKLHDRTLASAGHEVHGHRAVLRMHNQRRLPPGRYDLVVRTTNRYGVGTTERAKIVLR